MPIVRESALGWGTEQGRSSAAIIVISLPSPSAFGLAPSVFPDWRSHQPETIGWLASETAAGIRIKGLCKPVGSGKSLDVVGYIRLMGYQHAAILTGTRGLQAQYADSIGQAASFHMADLRGQSNYGCRKDGGTAEHGSCKLGDFCEWREDGCDYFDHVRSAGSAEIVVLNYMAWLHLMTRPEEVKGSPRDYFLGGKPFDCLVLDEGDTAIGHLTDFLTIEIGEGLLRQCTGTSLPAEGTVEDLVQWAKVVGPRVKGRGGVRAQVEAKRLRDNLDKLGWLGQASVNWVARREGKGLWSRLTVQPVQVKDQVEVLLQGVPDVVVMSATLTEQDMESFCGGS